MDTIEVIETFLNLQPSIFNGKKDFYLKYKKNVYQAMTLITQFSFNMLVPIFLCSFIGWYLDQKFGTSFLFVLLFFVGALAGFRNVYIFAKKIYESKDPEEDGNRKRNVNGNKKDNR